MAIEEMFTELPTVGSAQLSDIICAVQGYVSPSSLGLSVQESLQQVYNLFQSNIILFNAGNPNGILAGTTYQFCWDTVDQALFICTTSGSTSTAVWTQITNSASSLSWSTATTTPTSMAVNKGYVNANAGAAIFTIPSFAKVGDQINLVGNGAGGWLIVGGTGQQIIVGSTATTIGSGGVASTNRYDSIQIVCVVANTTWQTNVAPQGNLTIT